MTSQSVASVDHDTVDRASSIAPPVLSIIIPTLNERHNIEPLVAALTAALDGIQWEAIFVDGSSLDGTAERIQMLARSKTARAANAAQPVRHSLLRSSRECSSATPLTLQSWTQIFSMTSDYCPIC